MYYTVQVAKDGVIAVSQGVFNLISSLYSSSNGNMTYSQIAGVGALITVCSTNDDGESPFAVTRFDETDI